MAGLEFDASELHAFAADLAAAGSGIADKVRPVVHRGANNIARQLRREMSRSKWFHAAARDIDYSMTNARVFGVGVIEAEIGPRSDGQRPGDLAPLAYFGGSNGGGGNVQDPKVALEEEAPRFQTALEQLMEGLL